MKHYCYLSLGANTTPFLLTTLILAVSFPILPLAAETRIHFTEQTQQSGIHFEHINGASQHKYLPETMGAGGLFFDYDNDGHLDIYLVNSGTLDRDIQHQRQRTAMNVLYRNNGDETFIDTTAAAGLQHNPG
ncbi:MAG: VCBS repeat-containing protein, partial [Candidatus Poribacteria bacterium]|nr:VCBS repeat-containing protein [Candidatus Poribacteria bacterium]